MIDQHVRNLRLDRRLANRPGWIGADELEKELAALPDVSAKGEQAGDAAGDEAPTPEAAASAEP